MPFLGKTPSQIVDPEVDIDGGTIDGVSIGSVTANAGAFTNLTATGTLTLPDDGISGDDVNGGTISNFASTGIDDNATSTAITIDSAHNVGVKATSPSTYSSAADLVVDTGAAGGITVVSDSTSGGYGALFFADGTSGNEQYRGFVQYNHNNTTVDQMLIGTSATTAITIDSSQNVGIGTSPSNLLHVDKDTGSTPTVYINNSGADATDGAALKVQASGRGTGIADTSIFSVHNISDELFTVRNDGFVGIGQPSPTHLLHIRKASADNYIRLGSNGANDAGIYFNTGTDWTIGTDTSNSNAFDLSNSSSVGGASKVVVTTGGNVGIGTTSPAGPLHIQSATNRTIILDGTQATGSFTWQSIRRSGTEKWRWFLENDDDVTLYADVNSTGSVMRWASNGNVGIGTTSPSYKLDVDVGAPAGQDQLLGRFSSQAGTRSIAFVWDDSASTLGIGTQTNHSLAFHINGSSAERLRIDTYGGLNIKSVAGTQAATFGGSNLVNGITALPSSAATPFVVGRDTGSTRSAHFAGHLKFDAGYGIDYGVSGGSGITVSSNVLDDYEEGTWSPSIASGSASFYDATYTKVGRLVHLSVLLISITDLSSGTALQINGLPFASNNSTFVTSTGLSRFINRGNGTIVAYIGGNSNVVNFYALSAGADYLVVRHADLNNANANYYLNITYQT
jgi:hypothetical protein